MNKSPEQIQVELAEFFPAEVLGFKPQATNGERALAVAYIDARDVADRLDAVVGIAGWKDEYHVFTDGNVACTLFLKFGDEWVGKTDVGGESDQKDEGDRKKAAFSDALKRAAIKWGIGRYLYSMPTQWCDFDPKKKAFTRPPAVPAAFLPKAKGGQPARPAAPPAHVNEEAAAMQQPKKPGNGGAPKDGAELASRLAAKAKKDNTPGLLAFLADRAAERGWSRDMTKWDVTPAAVEMVTVWVGDFAKLQAETRRAS